MERHRLTKHFRNAVVVFEGGGVRGAAYAGAYRAALDRGVRIRAAAGTSAGSIAATLVSSGFTAERMEELFQNDFLPNLLAPAIKLPIKTPGVLGLLSGLPLIKNSPKVRAFRQLGSYSSAGIENWLNALLSEQLQCPGKIVTFGQLTARPLFVLAANIREAKVKVWSTFATPDDSVAFAVRCSCSIPFFFQPVTNGIHAFVDGGILSNLPVQLANRHDTANEPYPTLAFRLVSDPEMYPSMPESSEGMLRQIVDTVISGHAEMELQMSAPVAEIKIPTGKISSTNFGLTGGDTQTLIDNGSRATNDFFDQEDVHVANLPSLVHRAEQTDRGMWLDKSMRVINSATRQIILFGGDCSWVFALAPCLMVKRRQGIDVRVLYQNDHPPLDPMKVMPALGCDVRKAKSRVWLRGALVDGDTSSSTMILCDQNPEAMSRFGRILDGSTDRRLLGMVKEHFDSAWAAGDKPTLQVTQPSLQVLSSTENEKLLRRIPQYRKASIGYEIIAPREVCWLTTALEPFKLSRVEFLVSLLEELGIDRFKSLWIRGTPKIIGAPIIEELNNGKRVLLDGHHRMYYCIENGIDQVSAVVIKGVNDPLPASVVDSWENLRVLSERLPRPERYTNYKSQHFRPISEAFEAAGAEFFNNAGVLPP
jgi:predicted acylesterase/phospholipase RssA